MKTFPPKIKKKHMCILTQVYLFIEYMNDNIFYLAHTQVHEKHPSKTLHIRVHELVILHMRICDDDLKSYVPAVLLLNVGGVTNLSFYLFIYLFIFSAPDLQHVRVEFCSLHPPNTISC